MSQQQKKARRVAPDPANEGASGSTPHSSSPPRFSALHKGKAREVQKQSTPRYRKRPGPNAQARAVGRELQKTPPVPDQDGALQQREGGTSTSRRPARGETEKLWIQIAKAYGMLCSPWVPEPKPGEGDSGDHEVDELVDFLDLAKISHDERTDPRFCSNVSSVAQPSNLNAVLMLIPKVPARSSGGSERDCLSSERDCNGAPWLWRYS